MIVDVERRLLINGNRKIKTAEQNIRLLVLLAANPECLVSYERIGSVVWPAYRPSRLRHSICMALLRLRADTTTIGATVDIINLSGQGYILRSPIEVQCAVVIPTDVIADLRQLLRSCQNQALARSVADRLGIGAHG